MSLKHAHEERSGRALDSDRIEGLWVRASPEALHCVLEQDALSSA